MIVELAVTVLFVVATLLLCAVVDGARRIRWCREEAEREIARGGGHRPRYAEGEGRSPLPGRPSPTITRVGAWVRGPVYSRPDQPGPRVRLKGAVRGEGPVPARAPRPAPKDAA